MLYDPKWQIGKIVIDPDFEAAADYIERHGWVQGRNCDSLGRVCMIGAVLRATKGVSNSLLVSKRLYRRLGGSAEAYNDEPGRTKEQVVAKLRDLARGKGANEVYQGGV